MPHLLSDLNFPTLRKDTHHVWFSDHNTRHHHYSRASNGKPRPDLDSDGFTSQGTVVPGILHVGRLLGVAAFQGLPAPRAAQDGEDVGHMGLTTAADIIVSVLYMCHPKLLRRFLEVLPGQEFTYRHFMKGGAESIEWFGRLEERPFVIVRNGNMVEVSDSCNMGEASSAWEAKLWTTGYVWLLILTCPLTQAGFDETVVVNNEISVCWHSVVKYTIRLSGVWVQEFSKFCSSVPPGFFGPTQEKESLGRIEGLYERKKFEEDSIEILAPALTQCRWIERSGFRIKVVFLPLAQERPSIWESSLGREEKVEPGEKEDADGRNQDGADRIETIED